MGTTEAAAPVQPEAGEAKETAAVAAPAEADQAETDKPEAESTAAAETSDAKPTSDKAEEAEKPASPEKSASSEKPAASDKPEPESAIVQKVPRYRCLDTQCVHSIAKLDPGSVGTGDLPERIDGLKQNVFLESSDLFAPGSYVGFGLTVPDRPLAYRARGVVRWISDDPKGFGLQLFEVTSEKVDAAKQASAVQEAPAEEASAPVGGSSIPLPEPETMSELLAGLLGKEIKAETTSTWQPTADRPACVAAFGPDDGPTSCLWVFDMDASIYTGAALTMTPPEEAKEAVKANELREGFVENVHEIFNVGSSLFNAGDAQLMLKDAHVTKDELPAGVQKLLDSPPARLDLEIDVPDYGKGKVSVIVS